MTPTKGPIYHDHTYVGPGEDKPAATTPVRPGANMLIPVLWEPGDITAYRTQHAGLAGLGDKPERVVGIATVGPSSRDLGFIFLCRQPQSVGERVEYLDDVIRVDGVIGKPSDYDLFVLRFLMALHMGWSAVEPYCLAIDR